MKHINKGLVFILALTILIVGSGFDNMAWTYSIQNTYPGDPYTTQWLYDNMAEVWNYFTGVGCTDEAAAGIIGNMCIEGVANPGQVEIGWPIADPSSGRGLIGWTPGTKIINYADSVGGNWYDGALQCQFINNYPSQNFLPNPSHGYNYSWSEFKQITDYEVAVYAFFWEAERGTPSTIQARVNYAYKFYTDFHGSPPTPTPPGPDPDPPPTPQPPGSMDMKLIGGRDVMRRLWFKK